MVTGKHGRPITSEYFPDTSEFYGLSTDTKPTDTLTASGAKIVNGSIFVEVDTGDLYLYDEENSEWNKIS